MPPLGETTEKDYSLRQRYDQLDAARRQREGTPARSVEAMVRGKSRENSTGPFPATLDEQLAAVSAAGFRDVDCFWKDGRRALVGGYA